MKVVCYPADRYGCGHHRVIWPAQVLIAAGHDIEIVMPERRSLSVKMNGDEVIDVDLPDGVDVMAFQRVTHRAIPQVMKWCAERGIATTIDIDDDLGAVHPNNPAAPMLNLRYNKNGRPDRTDNLRDPRLTHSWRFLELACRYATVITVATPELAKVYGAHRPTHVIPNYLHSSYYGLPHQDSDTIGWPASLHSHPNDPQVMGNAMHDLVRDGADFVVISDPQRVDKAFNLALPPRSIAGPPLELWPMTIAQSMGIGIAPLANTKFNRSKSWLKPLEMSAVGIPWVASPRQEYQRLHVLEPNAGLLAANPREWYDHLTALRRDEVMRKEMSDAGRELAAGLKLEDNAWRWMEAWDAAYRLVGRSS